MRMLPILAALCAGMAVPVLAADGPIGYPDDLEQWIAVAPPKKGSDAWFAANHDTGNEWFVRLRDGHPHVKRSGGQQDGRLTDRSDPLPFRIEPGSAAEGLAGRRLSRKVADGWIVAFNAGEFGAGLWWFSPDGQERYKIAEAWVKDFHATETGLLALEGLAHMRRSRGRLIRLARDRAGRWRSEDLVDLKHAPEVAVASPDGSLLIATTDRLLRVVPSNRSVEVLLNEAFWGGLSPNSMVVTPGGTIYLGMRHGVARLEKNGDAYKVLWLLPNKAFTNRGQPPPAAPGQPGAAGPHRPLSVDPLFHSPC